MASRAEVEQALAAAIANVIYPQGPERDPVIGTPCRIYRGWPVSAALEAEMAAGVVHVTVVPVAGSHRDTTRFSAEWQGAAPAPSLTATVLGESVRFDGLAGAGQTAGVRVDGQSYAYRVSIDDTPGSVAAALTTMIGVDRLASASGRVLSVPLARDLLARVVADGEGGRELRRQVAGFRVTFWCPDPDLRDRVPAVVEVALADTAFLDVGGWGCRLRLTGGGGTDESGGARVWRRDLVYSIEYPTVTAEALPSMLFGVADVNGAPSVS